MSKSTVPAAAAPLSDHPLLGRFRRRSLLGVDKQVTSEKKGGGKRCELDITSDCTQHPKLGHGHLDCALSGPYTILYDTSRAWIAHTELYAGEITGIWSKIMSK